MQPALGFFSVAKSKFSLIALILILIVLSYFILTKFYKSVSNSEQNLSYSSQEQSIFQQVTDNPYSSILEEFYRATSNSPYWQNWNIQENMIAGDVIKVYPESKELFLKIFGPRDKEFSGGNRVGVNCSPVSTVLLLSRNLEFSKGSFNLFDEVKKGDIFYAYCLDDLCNNIGRECVLISN